MGDRAYTDTTGALQRLSLALLYYVQNNGSLPGGSHSLRRAHPARKLAFSFGGLVVLAALIWVAGNMFAVNFKLQNTIISARNSDSQLRKAIKTKADAYRLRIQQPDGAIRSFSLAEASLKVNTKGTVADARHEQQSLKQRLQWWKPIPIKLVISADTEALQSFIALHTMVTVDPARDASLTIADGSAQLVEGAAGKQFGIPDPAHTILAAASSLQTAPLKMRDTVQEPQITTAALAGAKAKIDSVLKQSVVITVNGAEVKPDSTVLASWLTTAPNNGKKTVDINVNRDAIKKYLEGVADDHSRASKPQVSFQGTVITAGVSGVHITNTGDPAQYIADHLLEAKGLKVDLPVEHTGFKTVSSPTSGKWLEVDLTAKRMYAYDQNGLQRTFLVSAGAPDTPTVTGTFAIFSKLSSQTMRGPNADGSRYVQPDVPWVNYFYRDYAIHGNYWRPLSYFGNVNSSHGCVGLTPGEAKWVYDWAPIGTPVVVHR